MRTKMDALNKAIDTATTILKSHVSSYSRTSASGAVSTVREHDDSRGKRIDYHTDVHKEKAEFESALMSRGFKKKGVNDGILEFTSTDGRHRIWAIGPELTGENSDKVTIKLRYGTPTGEGIMQRDAYVPTAKKQGEIAVAVSRAIDWIDQKMKVKG